jgi:hypothetical protein
MTTLAERHDPATVLHLVDAYWQRRQELDAAGRYPYHSEFYDLVPDAERPETPIYVLAGLYQMVRGCEEEAACWEQGMDRLESLSSTQKFERAVVFAWHFSGFGSHERYEWTEARIVPDVHGKPHAVLPKGKRTHGCQLNGSAVVYVSGGER